MRKALYTGIALSILCIALSIMSLWYFGWLSPGRSTRLSLSQGRLWIWVGQPNDFAAWRPGFDSGGWTGSAIDWNAEFKRRERIYVPSGPTPAGNPPGTPVVAKAIHGLSITIPIWIPLGLTIIPTALLPVAIAARARRRAARGRCRACGYDRAGAPGPCPECGTLFTRLLKWLRERVRPLSVPARQERRAREWSAARLAATCPQRTPGAATRPR